MRSIQSAERRSEISFMLGLLFACNFWLFLFSIHSSIYAEEGIKEFWEPKVVCPPKEKEDLVLDVITRVKDAQKVIFKLGKDGIEVISTETDENFTVLRVGISTFSFQKIFSGKTEFKLVQYSSRTGFYCQRYIRGYKIPIRYRKYVREIRIPDPQIE
ncbi:hypothetical protein [Leptospira mayottensis]|nr:hypothetical protein [Leptospira mayottensis]